MRPCVDFDEEYRHQAVLDVRAEFGPAREPEWLPEYECGPIEAVGGSDWCPHGSPEGDDDHAAPEGIDWRTWLFREEIS
jgi:hypothetical protein